MKLPIVIHVTDGPISAHKSKKSVLSVYLLFFALGITFLLSCNREYHTATMDVTLVFCPRTCTCLWISHGLQDPMRYVYKFPYDPTIWTDTIPVKSFYISVMTGNKELKSLRFYGKEFFFVDFDESGELQNGYHIYSLEEEIKLDYEAHYFANNLPDQNGELSTYFLKISYRTEGITKLKISAIDKPLFGKATGESLNEYFGVKFPYQTYIASYKTKSLLYGLMNDDYPQTIDDWLGLNPLAQPTMYFPLKTYPGDLPVTTRFKIEMETDNGIQLTDTSRMITLTK